MKSVVFSDDLETLRQQRAFALALGISVQLRDVRAFVSGWVPDAQFKNSRAVLKLAGDRWAQRAQEIRTRYEELGVVFYDDVSDLVKAEAERQLNSPTADVVEGVDTPSKGPGTYEDMKPKRARR
jgi:hypothetical protein